MIFIDNGNVRDPRVNLALEEYAFRELKVDDDYLLFYINDPSVIIGKHQNTLEEINEDFIEKNGVQVIRRISGGGAVYHDHGNLNFSFITKFDRKKFNKYEAFTSPIIQTLNELGVNARLNGRNDIVVGDKKISGNAQFTSKDRMFSHGTLLYDSNLEDVLEALKVKSGKIESKGIKSIRSRVANISEFMDRKIGITAFKQLLLKNIFRDSQNIPTYQFNPAEWTKINELVKTKYSRWDWNYGESPKFNVKNSRRFSFGEIEARILVEKGLIQQIKFYGDFFAKREISELERLLTQIRYEKGAIEKALQKIDPGLFFGDISVSELVQLIY